MSGRSVILHLSGSACVIPAILTTGCDCKADGFAFASGIALLVSYVIDLECVAAAATLKGETNKNRYSWRIFVAYGLLAYLLTVIVFALLS